MDNDVTMFDLKALRAYNKSVKNASDISTLQTMFEGISSMSPKGVYDTVDDLETAFPTGNDNVYVVKADGKWYYWDDEWLPGDTYQAVDAKLIEIEDEEELYEADNVEDALQEVKTELDAHKFDYAQLIGNAELITDDKTIKGAINETKTQVDIIEDLVESVIDEDITAVLENELVATDIADKLNALETEYAPRLTGIEAQLEDIVISVKSFGAIGDGVTDDTVAIQNAINYVSTIKKATLFFPKSDGFLTSSPLIIPVNVNVKMDSALIYNGEGIALTIGDADTSNKVNLKLAVYRKIQADWASESDIGIKIFRLYESIVEIVEARRFTIGLQLMAENSGFAYNNFKLINITDNKIGIDLTNKKTTSTGWCNENIFIGGRFAIFSSNQSAGDSYAVRFNSEIGEYNNNNNVFIKPSFEGRLIPVLCNYGNYNRIENCRYETSNNILAIYENSSSTNFISTLCTKFLNPIILDNSKAANNTYVNGRLHNFNISTPIFAVYDLDKKLTEYSADLKHISHVLSIQSVPSITITALKANIVDNYLELGNRGIGVYIDTSNINKFIIGGDRQQGYGGRVFIVCFDENGTQLTNDKKYVNYIYYASSFGGSYKSGEDSNYNYYISLHEDVKKIFVGMMNGTNPLRIKSFIIETVDKANAPNVSFYPNVDKRLAITQPVGIDIHYDKGTIIYNNDVQELGTEGNKYIITGWVCTDGGEPGTWLPLKSLTGN